MGVNVYLCKIIQLIVIALKNSRRKICSRFKDYSLLDLDHLMTGRFWPMFSRTIIASLVIFAILYGLFWLLDWLLCRGSMSETWSPGEAFVQMTNPARHPDFFWHKSAYVVDWIFIVVFNLFGLFVLNGVVLTILVNWVSNRKDSYEKGETRYELVFKKRFKVVIGGHKMVASLARDLIALGDIDYLVIQTQRNPQQLRREIAAEITDEESLHKIVVYSGDRTSPHEVEELQLDKALAVYLIGEPSSIDGTSHDAINMQAWKLITSRFKINREPRIPCHVMFEYQSTFTAFQNTDLKLDDCKTFRFIPFSIYENWAQQVLVNRTTDDNSYYMPLDGLAGLSYSSHQRAHLIVVGMSKMGMAIAVEAAHVAHYPNFNNKHAGNPRTLITFIDRNAKREMTYFMGRFRELFQLARWRYVQAPDELINPGDGTWNIYDTQAQMQTRPKTDDPYRWHEPMLDEDCNSPYFGGYLGENLIDIDFEFIEGDVSLPSIQKYIADACADCSNNHVARVSESGVVTPDDSSITTVAICFPAAVESMSTALYFESSVYDNVQQIWVQQSDSGALVDAVRFGLTGQEDAKFRSLRPFGMIEKCEYLKRMNSPLPRLVAYAYDCMDRGTTLEAEFNRSDIHQFISDVNYCWESMTSSGGKSVIAKRWSNIYCANNFESKVFGSGIDTSVAEPLRDDTMVERLAKVEHNRWVIEQLLLGIRPVGKSYAGKLPIDDRQLRSKLKSKNIHPDIVSNGVLGKSQSYDLAIARIIPLAMAIADKYWK